LPDQPELGDRARLLQPSIQEIFDVDLPVLVPEQLAPVFRQELPRLVRRWQEHDKLAVMAATLDLSKLLFAWVAQRWKELGLRKPVDLEARLRQAEDLALASLSTPFGVSDFAKAAGLSRAHFSEVFRKRRGVGPAAFLRDERMSRACHLLATTDVPIGEIGAAVGYPEPTVFGRAFRAQTGKSPRQYRERAQSKRA
ncbi:MAG TPA: AraC family transcriptional regulator, partial [Polyangiaceae bacterium]|nr:AraC family transcriptional regulator [Polyangiaceae bacterium]